MKLPQRLKQLIPSRRKLIQLYFALLFNVNFKGFATGTIYRGASKQFCVPGLNCYSCPGAVGACPLGALQSAFSGGHGTLWYVCGILALYGVLFGRWICGWLCPFGLIQELLHKIRVPKLAKSPVTKFLSRIKYGILIIFVILIPLCYAFRSLPLPAFCKYICPAGTLEGGLTLLSHKANTGYFSMLGSLFTWKVLLLISICIGSVFIFRLFCRFLCPLGALYGLFNRFSFFGIHTDHNKCIDCDRCVRHCKVDIRRPGDMECVSCGDCVRDCPTQAISWKGSGIFLRQNESSTTQKQTSGKRFFLRATVSVLMLGLLAGAALYHGNATPVVSEGSSVGDRCPGYALQRIDGTGILNATVDPTATGKITVINFWGTWCTPCIRELPAFDQLATQYADGVTVIAVHTNMLRDTAPSFILKNYPDSPILFASDYVTETSTSEQYYTALGGRGTYPYTVVLDAEGIIRAIFTEPLEYEDLVNIILPMQKT